MLSQTHPKKGEAAEKSPRPTLLSNLVPFHHCGTKEIVSTELCTMEFNITTIKTVNKNRMSASVVLDLAFSWHRLSCNFTLLSTAVDGAVTFRCNLYFFSQLEKSYRELQENHNKEENALRAQINKLQQEKRQLQDAIGQFQANEQTQKQEFDQVLYRAHEMLERETQEKLASMAEQKSLRQQVENLSKNMKSLQVHSDMLVFVTKIRVLNSLKCQPSSEF